MIPMLIILFFVALLALAILAGDLWLPDVFVMLKKVKSWFVKPGDK